MTNSEPESIPSSLFELDPIDPEGAEDEQDLDSHDALDFNAALASADWTVDTLVNQMRKGRINLNPSFQRRNAWLDPRKSQLIESVMLKYPIPQLVLAEQRDSPGSYLVIDGKQRLLALRQFCSDPTESRDRDFEPLTLRGLEILDDLNGMNWQRVQAARPDLAATFENHTIRTVVISNWSSEALLMSLFLRLNTGSVSLSPQELRQALHPGPFSDWIDERSSGSEALRRLLKLQAPDRRMVDAELLLRHLSFRLSSRAYRSNLKKFLDDSTGEYNSAWPQAQAQLDSALRDMEEGIEAGMELFGEQEFCRRWRRGRYERPFNRALFDVQVGALADAQVRAAALRSPSAMPDAFRMLSEGNPEFVQAITLTTKTGAAFRTRFEVWDREVSQALGVSFELPPCLYRPESS